jgi:hypothetical protein
MLFSFSFKLIRPFHFSDWKSFCWGHWGLYMQSNPLRIYRETAGKVCRCRWLKCSHPREQSSHRQQQQLITIQTVWMLLSQILRDFQRKREKGISLHRAGATAAEVYRVFRLFTSSFKHPMNCESKRSCWLYMCSIGQTVDIWSMTTMKELNTKEPV